MTFEQFIHQAKLSTIHQLDNGTWYLEPEWKDIVSRDVESNLEQLEDNYLTDWWDIENVLRLETERRNAQDSKKNDVINWIYDIITATVDPAAIDEENELMKNMIEYMKTKNNP